MSDWWHLGPCFAATSTTAARESALSAFCRVLDRIVKLLNRVSLPEPSIVPRLSFATFMTYSVSRLIRVLQTDPKFATSLAPISAATATTSLRSSALSAFWKTDVKFSAFCAPISPATSTTSASESALSAL